MIWEYCDEIENILSKDKDFSFTSLDIELSMQQIQEISKIDARLSNNFVLKISELLDRVMHAFQTYGYSDFLRIRGMINKYECLGKGPYKCFMNRSAMKFANLDYAFNLIERRYETKTMVYLDICGGPGGFVEYLFSRCFLAGFTTVLGFGLSILLDSSSIFDSCNWNLAHLKQHDLFHVIFSSDRSMQTARPLGSRDMGLDERKYEFNVVNGATGDGDITNSENIEYLESYIANRFVGHDATQNSSPNYESRPWDTLNLEHFVNKHNSVDLGLDYIDSKTFSALGPHALPGIPEVRPNEHSKYDHELQHRSKEYPHPRKKDKQGVTCENAIRGYYVDLVTADGGSEEGRNQSGRDNNQYRLLYCQIIAMIQTLKGGGDFVLKVFSPHEVRGKELW